jgi:type 1 glutamine amidotransferase
MTDPARLLLVAGRPSHGSGMHEFRAGARLLAHCLADVPGLVVEVSEDGVLPDLGVGEVDAVVVYADGGPSHPLHDDDGWARLDSLARQGVGLGFLHYAVEAPVGQGDQELSRWIGGVYEDSYSCNPIFDAQIDPVPDHPISHGVVPFSAVDEWYFNIRFTPDRGAPIRSVLVATPSDEVRAGPYVWPAGPYPHVIAAGGREEALLWATERSDNGRGFGFTGGHFHRNWENPDFRRVVLNALVWVSGLHVPGGGVQSSLGGYDVYGHLDPAPQLEEV